MTMQKDRKRTNLRGTVFGFLLYSAGCFIAYFWLFIFSIVLPTNADGTTLISTMSNSEVFSWWGGAFVILQGVLAYYSGRLCAHYSSNDGTQKPIVLAFLLIIPTIIFGVLFIGATKVIEVGIICIVAGMAVTSGFDSYIEK